MAPAAATPPLLLPFREPLHAEALLAALAAHAVPGVERTDLGARTHIRAVRTPGGPAVMTVAFREGHVAVSTRPPVAAAAWVEAAVRRWFDLAADPVAVDAALAGDPLLGPSVRARPGLRVLGYADADEGAVMTVIGQQVSLAATRTFGGRLAAAFGTRVDEAFSVYPTARELAAIPPDEVQRAVGLTRTRARTVVTLAEALAAGTRLDPAADTEVIRSSLLALPGIGSWTVDYLSVRALGDRDGFVPDDLVLRRALGGATAREASAMAESWRPYRAYALYHLWTRAAYL